MDNREVELYSFSKAKTELTIVNLNLVPKSMKNNNRYILTEWYKDEEGDIYPYQIGVDKHGVSFASLVRMYKLIDSGYMKAEILPILAANALGISFNFE